MEAYNNINIRTLEYQNKVNKRISEEDYELREKILKLADEFSTSFELNEIHRRQNFKRKTCYLYYIFSVHARFKYQILMRKLDIM